MFIVLLSHFFSFAGTNISGGGFVYKNPQSHNYVLVDALEVDRNYSESCSEFDLVKSNHFGRHYGFFSANKAVSQESKLALDTLDRWLPKSPIMAKVIRTQLTNLSLHFTTRPIAVEPPANNRYAAPSLTSKAKKAAVYLKGFGFFLQLDVWNNMCTKSRVALLIHEALRSLQIDFNALVDLEQLQQLTAQIVWGDPSVESLDSLVHFSFLTSSTKVTERIKLDPNSLRQNSSIVCNQWVRSGKMMKVEEIFEKSYVPVALMSDLIFKSYVKRGVHRIAQACAKRKVFSPQQLMYLDFQLWYTFWAPLFDCGRNPCTTVEIAEQAHELTGQLELFLPHRPTTISAAKILASVKNLETVSRDLDQWRFHFPDIERKMNDRLKRGRFSVRSKEFFEIDKVIRRVADSLFR